MYKGGLTMNAQAEHNKINRLLASQCIEKAEARRLHKAIDSLARAIRGARGILPRNRSLD